MKYCFLIISFIFFISFSYSSNKLNNLDSIKKKIENYNETNKFEFLNNKIWALRNTEPTFAKKIAFFTLEQYKFSRQFENKSMTLNYLGVLYRNIGQLDSADIYFRYALVDAKKFKDTVQIGYSYNNIANIYKLRGINVKALEYTLKGLQIFEKINDIQGQAYCYISLGIIFRNQNDYKNAFKYTLRAIELREKLNDRKGKAIAVNQLAEIYFEKKDYLRAIDTFNKLLPLYKELNDKKGISACYAGIAGVYFELKKYTESLEYRFKALNIDTEINYQFGIALNHIKLAEIFMLLNKMDESFFHLNKGQNIALQSDFTNLVIDSYRIYSELYEKLNQFSASLNYHKKYETLKDSIASNKAKQSLELLRTSYEIEKIDRENKSLKEQLLLKDQTATYLNILIILIILLLILNHLRLRANKKANKTLNELNNTRDKFFRLIFHDIKNPLNSMLGISDLLESEYKTLSDEDKIELITELNKSTKKLYILLEELLAWASSQSKSIASREEIFDLCDVIQDVKEIYSTQMAYKNITFYNLTEKGLFVNADRNMINTIFRNIICNSANYTPSNGKIEVSSKIKQNKVIIAIKDNGKGITPDLLPVLFDISSEKRGALKSQSGTGLGLIISKEFIEKNNGSISVESEIGKGTTFYIELPYYKINN